MSPTIDANGAIHAGDTGRFTGHILQEASVTVLNTDETLVTDTDVADGLAMGLPGYHPGHAYDLREVRSRWRTRAVRLGENAFAKNWDALVEAKRGECWATAIGAEIRDGSLGLPDLPEWVTQPMSQADFQLTYAEDFPGGPDDAEYADFLADRWTKRYMDAVLAMSGDSGMPKTLMSA